MRIIYPSGYEKPDWPVLMEVRTSEHGKLLLQVVENGTEPMLLIKLKGNHTVYGLIVRELLALCFPTVHTDESDKT